MRFHLVKDAAVILWSKGVFRQAKVYLREDKDGEVGVYAAHGSGFIRLHRQGTGIPNITVEGFDADMLEIGFSRLGKMTATVKTVAPPDEADLQIPSFLRRLAK